jgi:pimeloyl-ACP methyl ester carboxylesterase
MFVERHGTGPIAYFGLHGWGGGRETFIPLARHVPESATLYAADLPGYGRSPAPDLWDVEVVGEKIADAIAATGARRVTLVGNCSGAIFGLIAARHLDDRIARFVLIDPFAFVPWYFNLFVATSFGRYAYYSTFANPFGRWLTNLSLRGRRTSRSNLTGSFSRVDHKVAYSYLEMLAGIDGIERFGGVSAPIEIVYGEKTFGAIKQSVERWRSLWPHARSFELSGAGHLPLVEATDRLAQIIFTEAGRQKSAAGIEDMKLLR